MKIDPFEQDTQRSPGKLAGHFARGDFDGDLVLSTSGMDMRRIVIVVVHEDDDAVEAADDGHWRR